MVYIFTHLRVTGFGGQKGGCLWLVKKGGALPKAWVVPIRQAIYSVLAGCLAFICCNAREPKFTHYLVIVTIVAVAAVTPLDCWVDDDDRKN